MTHLPHRSHKNSIQKWSGLHLKIGLSPTKNRKHQKVKIPLQNFQASHKCQIPYKQDQNCDRQFGENVCILTLDRQTTDTRQTQIGLLRFLRPRGPKRAEKKFQPNRKKRNFGDCSNICLSGLRTYNKLRITVSYLSFIQ